MPTKYKDYPIYTYDEPSTHSDFSGGINTDPSNEHLLDNEMRDCINMDFLSGALVKRKGADILSNIICDDDLNNIQGIFIYTSNLTYLIIASDGKLYYGLYDENIKIQLTRLYIEYAGNYSDLLYNPLDTLAGLQEYSYNISEKHEGYIQTYFIDPANPDNKYITNDRGYYDDITSGSFSVGDTVTFLKYEYPNKILRKFLCIKTFVKELIYPTNTLYWEEEANSSVQYPLDWKETFHFKNNDRAIYNGTIYRCKQEHYNYTILPDMEASNKVDQHYFVCIDTDYPDAWKRQTYLTFQNYRPIEFATLNDKVFVATGTRLVEIYTYGNALRAKPITPYQINNTELINIGFNYLSPYPELNIASQKDTVTTQLYSIKTEKLIGGTFKLTPILSVSQQDNLGDYLFRWEKLVDDVWYCIKTFKSQLPTNITSEEIDATTIRKTYVAQLHDNSLEVSDADKYQYRVTMAKYFEYPVSEYADAQEWLIDADYDKDDVITNNGKYYICLYSHKATNTVYTMNKFNIAANIVAEVNGQEISQYIVLWKELYAEEQVPLLKREKTVEYPPEEYPGLWEEVRREVATSEETNDNQFLWVAEYRNFYAQGTEVCRYLMIDNEFYLVTYRCLQGHYSKVNYVEYQIAMDLKVDKLLEVENHTAFSVIFKDIDVEDTFLTINSCTKILADGYKLLLYNDRYNSGMWFKSIISNPYYITDRGNLSFKTTKNEQVVKVVPFQGNLIVFANSDTAGGSIHLVSGNGDDYNANDGYYSPYQRRTINSSISCDNANTIQVCDNILIFKYFNRIYYINASDLNNDIVRVTPCNDRVLSKNSLIEIPWDDNDCISVVTKDYYALLWKEKYTIDDNGDLILLHKGIRLKLYYKLSNQLKNDTYVMPWLRDESEYFNVQFVLYAKGRPLYLYHNLLLTFDNNVYTDLDSDYDIKIITKGYSLEYPQLIKLIHNLTIYYHRDQRYPISLKLQSRNEAGHRLITFNDNKKSSQELKVLFANNSKHLDTSLRLDSTIQDVKVVNASYAFPALLADVELIATTKGRFSLSSLTFNYTTSEGQDTTQFDLYNKIIRPIDLKETKDD